MAILCLLLLFSSISLTLVAPFLPVVGKEKGLSNTDVGIVIGTSFVTTMMVSPICGNFLHVGGSRRWLFVGEYLYHTHVIVQYCMTFFVILNVIM